MTDEFDKLVNDNASLRENCDFCKESKLEVGKKTRYGSVVICRIGKAKNGWFATLSPKTGGDPRKDFTVQLMPFAHLTHFSQISSNRELAKNYGTLFSKISRSISKVMLEDKNLKALANSKELGISIATYGKCTTWKEKKEHLHVKIFPFRGNIGQPYTLDSSFERKKIRKDPKTGEEFVKMMPVRKVMIDDERFDFLSKLFIFLLDNSSTLSDHYNHIK